MISLRFYHYSSFSASLAAEVPEQSLPLQMALLTAAWHLHRLERHAASLLALGANVAGDCAGGTEVSSWLACLCP